MSPMPEDVKSDHIDVLMDHILAYIEYLRRNVGLDLTIHHIDTKMSQYFYQILRYNVHQQPMCLYLKNNPEIFAECIRRQAKILNRVSAGPFFGTCWAGMGEFVFPIWDIRHSVAGFICVSGYAGDEAKRAHQHETICSKYGVNRADLEQLYENTVARSKPDMAFLKTLVEPLCDLFLLFFIYQKEAEAGLEMTKSNSEALMASVKRHIEKHYSENISLTELAARFHCSSDYLSHIIHKYAHCNYRGYVNGMKMRMARVYLEHTELSVKEITQMLGFSDSNYFSTVFRREIGQSPRQWRNEHTHPAKK